MLRSLFLSISPIDRMFEDDPVFIKDKFSSIDEHWMSGGTGVTNFEKHLLPIYEAAIKKHGDDSIFIEMRPMHGHYLMKKPHLRETHCSLHRKKNRGEGMTEFWRIFDEEKAAFTAIHRGSDKSKES